MEFGKSLDGKIGADSNQKPEGETAAIRKQSVATCKNARHRDRSERRLSPCYEKFLPFLTSWNFEEDVKFRANTVLAYILD